MPETGPGTKIAQLGPGAKIAHLGPGSDRGPKWTIFVPRRMIKKAPLIFIFLKKSMKRERRMRMNRIQMTKMHRKSDWAKKACSTGDLTRQLSLIGSPGKQTLINYNPVIQLSHLQSIYFDQAATTACL